ncbi:RNA polymerase sigma-70 factor [Olivibacter sitiensis]|uniref:RNA polymerase sigma-70 factor n=1 Tax=Olivibacter sitiensis TaxID=376470 RepID=UPI0004205FFE|nr:RNA polymerase sigma-70 factor [Olivibacter sitiensis]
MNEELLIADFAKGNEVAFKTIFDMFHRRLIYFAGGIVPDSPEIEDIVQEAFEKLWNRRRHFHHLNAILSFLYLCVKNNCLNRLKHAKVKDKYQFRQAEQVDSHNAILWMIEAEVLEHMHQAIKKLPEGCQQVIYYGYFKGMNNKEIADKLCVSINTVKTQKTRALKSLRLLLKGIAVMGFVQLFNSFGYAQFCCHPLLFTCCYSDVWLAYQIN